jgi:hypothetical protein
LPRADRGQQPAPIRRVEELQAEPSAEPDLLNDAPWFHGHHDVEHEL